VNDSWKPGARKGIELDLTGLSDFDSLQVRFGDIRFHLEGIEIGDRHHGSPGIEGSSDRSNDISHIGILGQNHGIKGSPDLGILDGDLCPPETGHASLDRRFGSHDCRFGPPEAGLCLIVTGLCNSS